MWEREGVAFAGLVALTVALFTVTHFATRAYERRQDALARRWFARGEGELRAARVVPAIAELRTALVYSRDNFQYRLTLARALAAAGRTREAQAYLRALWDQEPGNGTVNLELARLAARQGAVADALRYFHGAIYGLWTEAPAQQRRTARLELIDFLLRENAGNEAQSELIALAADLPDEPPLVVHVADLMMKANEPARALELYVRVLRLDNRNAAALAGAGQAAFHMGRYREAQQYLRRAVPHLPSQAPAAALLETANYVLELDPLQPRLSVEERSRRLTRGAETVQAELEQCRLQRGEQPDAAPPQSDLLKDRAEVQALLRQLTVRELRRKPELIDAALELFARAEQHVLQQCGATGTAGRALRLIARQREGAQP